MNNDSKSPGVGIRWLAACACAAALAEPVQAIHVYVMSSGNASLDAAVQTLLTAHGHSSELGSQWFQFDGSASLDGFDAVYFQMNHNWDAAPDMPHFGQVAMRTWVEAGGGLVTTSWAQYVAAQGALLNVRELFPADPSSASTATAHVRYEQIVPDPILNAGLPVDFDFPTDDIGGTEGLLAVDPWSIFTDGPLSTVFYRTHTGGFVGGVIGGPAGSGWAINLSTTVGSSQIADPNFGQLLVNALVWVSSSHPAPAPAWCPCQVDPCACDGPGSPMHVYIMSSGEPRLDDVVQRLLTAYGHTSQIGAEWWQFDGTASLTGVDVVYMQVNYNLCGASTCSNADMPLSGQAALRDWVLAGGGLVTTEWALKKAAESGLTTLHSVFPAVPSTLTFRQSWLSFSQTATDPVLTAGLPPTFTFPADSIAAGGGTDCLPRPDRPDAVAFYETPVDVFLSYGLVAGHAGPGAVINLGSVVGPHQLADANFSRLLVNALAWASSGGAAICICETDGDVGQVDVFDLLVYLDDWFDQSPDADLDGSLGIDVFDLLTFLDCWFLGC